MPTVTEQFVNVYSNPTSIGDILTITSIGGKVITRTEITSTILQIDISDLPSGVYVISSSDWSEKVFKK